jgi:hypothetical protein
VVARQNTYKYLPLRLSVANKKCGNNRTEQKMWQQYDRSKSVATIGPRKNVWQQQNQNIQNVRMLKYDQIKKHLSRIKKPFSRIGVS